MLNFGTGASSCHYLLSVYTVMKRVFCWNLPFNRNSILRVAVTAVISHGPSDVT